MNEKHCFDGECYVFLLKWVANIRIYYFYKEESCVYVNKKKVQPRRR